MLARQQIETVSYPENYVAARKALQACVSVDECKDISDKYQAIAAYAKQARDMNLCNFAQRIKLRAIVRTGDLLNSIPDSSKRVSTASAAGLSNRQRYTAIHIADIPRGKVDSAIEASPPATTRHLTSMWKDTRGINRSSDRANTTKEYLKAISLANQALNIANQLDPLTTSLAKDEGQVVLRVLMKIAETIDNTSIWLEKRHKALSTDEKGQE